MMVFKLTSSSVQKSADGMSQARLGLVLSQSRFFSLRNQESRLSPTANTLTARAVPPHTPATETRLRTYWSFHAWPAALLELSMILCEVSQCSENGP